MFLTPDGKLMNVKAKANPKYGYYYPQAEALAAAMREAAEVAAAAGVDSKTEL